MPKYNVRYTGPSNLEVEADSQNEAEELALDETCYNWIAELVEEDDNG